MIELTQVRKKNGRFKHSAYHNWKKKKNRPWSDYSPYILGIGTLLGWLIFAQILPVYAHISKSTGEIEILREPADQSSSRGTASGNTGESVNADSYSNGESSTERSGEALEPRPTLSDESIVGKIKEAWFGTGEEDIAVAVAKSESGLNPQAKGDIPIQFWHEGKLIGHSCGVFQIRVLPGRPDCETLKDVDKNIDFARKLYDRSGFQPWSNFKNGAYLKHL